MHELMPEHEGKIIKNGIDLTRMYNEYESGPIKKHYPKAAAKATFPLLAIASHCMKTGADIISTTLLKYLIEKGEEPFDNGKCDALLDNAVAEAVNRFLVEGRNKIEKLPVTYYTRNKRILPEFIKEAIWAGIMFNLETYKKIAIKEETPA